MSGPKAFHIRRCQRWCASAFPADRIYYILVLLLANKYSSSLFFSWPWSWLIDLQVQNLTSSSLASTTSSTSLMKVRPLGSKNTEAACANERQGIWGQNKNFEHLESPLSEICSCLSAKWNFLNPNLFLAHGGTERLHHMHVLRSIIKVGIYSFSAFWGELVGLYQSSL